MKKEPINADNLMNELKGKSTYFNTDNGVTAPRTGATDADKSGIIQSIEEPPNERPINRLNAHIYRDQVVMLREIQHMYYKRTGKELTLSTVIREALDQYLPKLLEALGKDKL